MSKKCPYCGSIRIATPPSGDVSVCLACESFLNTVNGKSKQTVFDSVTASPAVLADKLVYDWGHLCHNGDVKIYWKSTILPDAVFYSKYEAIAATLEELKEVEE